jgi:hypothetical protein
MIEERMLKLKNELNSLLEWKRVNSVRQVQLPVGTITRQLVRKNVLDSTGTYISNSMISTIWIEVNLDGKLYWLAAKPN